MTLHIRCDRSTLPPSGGTRYLVVTLPGFSVPVESRTAVVIDWSQSLAKLRPRMGALVEQVGRPEARLLAFADVVRCVDGLEELDDWQPGQGSLLHEAWLRGCHAIAPEQADGRCGHCILVTDGLATLGEADRESLATLAAEIWQQASIATSVVAVGPRVDGELLKAIAWRGGGSYLRWPFRGAFHLGAPPTRVVLEFAPAEVEFLSPTRGVSLVEGRPAAVVSGLRQVVVAVAFRGSTSARLSLRLRSDEWAGEWQSLHFEVARSVGPPDAAVMRQVARALAGRTAPDPPAPPAPRRAGFPTAEGAAELVGRFVPASASWPAPLASCDRSVVVDLFRGCLIAGAEASALGRVLIGLDPATIRSRYGPEGLTHYEPWQPDLAESVGMVSGDTQITREVALTVVEGGGHFDPERFVARLLPLLANNRGLGQACERAGAALAQGLPWWKAGLAGNSAGNGAALRVAPLGLLWALSPRRVQLHREAVLSALVTHTHPLGVAATVVMALGVAWCVRQRLAGAVRLPAGEFLGFLADSIEGLEREPVLERRLGARPTTLWERIRELESLLSLPPAEALQVTWNGAFALESVPAALYCFLKFPGNPRRVIVTAVNGGHDADSVGCMAGQLAGAWAGAAALREAAPAWWEGLEGRDELHDLADLLSALALDKVGP